MIARVKENPRLTIPVIGNGDIDSPERLRDAFGRYGVDGVMVGRAAIGNPWIFNELKHGLYPADSRYEPLSLEQKFAIVRRQIQESIGRIDEYRGILHIRRHLAVCSLFKGIPNFRQTRIAMLRASTFAELAAVLDSVEAKLRSGEPFE